MKGLCKICPEFSTCTGQEKTKSKYKNQKVVVNEIKFDSKKEAKRYQELLLMKKAGIITDLKRQVPFTLVPVFSLNKNRYRPLIYIADFVYKENGKEIVEDTKGYRTEVYRIKKKLMAYIYQIEIREV
jgi:hypothetical protein